MSAEAAAEKQPIHSTAKTHTLAANLDNLSAEELKQAIVDLCQEDGNLRYKVNQHVEHKRHPPARSPSPDQKRSPSPTKVKRAAGESIMNRQPDKCPRVRAYRNGDDKAYVVIAARSIEEFLEMATKKLHMSNSARKIYDESGKRVTDLKKVKHDSIVFVSSGEEYRDPTGPPPATRVAKIAENSRLIATPAIRVTARRNGDPNSPANEVVVHMPGVHSADACFQRLLSECTNQLHMISACKRVFLSDGKEVKDVTAIEKGAIIVASNGEPFRGAGDARASPVKVKALPDDHRLFPTPAKAVMVIRNGYTFGAMQCVGNSLERILDDATVKLNLTSAARKLHNTEGKVMTFDTLERNHMYAVTIGEPFIAPDATERATSRIAPLPESSRLAAAPRVRLLAMKNGFEVNSSEAVRIVFGDVDTMLREVTRKLGLSSGARRMYTEDGKVVEATSKLSNDQPVWVSCGEPFKEPGSHKKVACKISPIKGDSRLLSQGKLRIGALKNGAPLTTHPRTIVGYDLPDLLSSAADVLQLVNPARRFFSDTGRPLTNFDQLARDMVVYVSCGEEFKDPRPKKQHASHPAETFEPPSPRGERPADGAPPK